MASLLLLLLRLKSNILIFCIAFLPCEVVELKQNNMEFNIAYSSSLEDELFTVHLMFEETVQGLPEDDDRLSPGGAFGRSNFVLPSYICPVEQADLAFEKGLEQVRNNFYYVCCFIYLYTAFVFFLLSDIPIMIWC